MVLLLALLAPAQASTPISLEDAVAAVAAHPSLRVAEASRDGSEAGVRLVRSAYDPVFSTGTSLQSADSKGFLAGYPTTSNATSWTTETALQATTPFGTTWSLAASLDQRKTASTLALGGSSEPQEQDTWGATVGVTIGQDLLAPLRATSQAIAVREATERLDQADVSVLSAKQSAIAEVATAWWTWSAAVDQAGITARAVDDAEALRERTRAWVDEGVVATLELDRVDADLLGARRDQKAADAEVRRAADALLVLIGGTPGDDVVPTGDGLWPATDTLDVATHVEAALAGNLDLALARLELDAARAAGTDARRSGLPSLTLSATGQLGTLTETAAEAITSLPGDDAFPTLGVGLDLSIPLGGRAAHARRDQAAAGTFVEEVQLADTERRVTASTRAAVDAVQTARESLELATAQVEVARRTEDGEAARVEEGARRTDELITARHARQAAEVDAVRAARDLAAAELELDRLEGRLASIGVP